MSTDAVTCPAFHESIEELALGLIDEPQRTALLAHAGSCPSCGSHLAELSVVADRLLLLAPEVEPPPGFEARAIARVQAAAPGALGALGERREPRGPGRRWLAVAATVAVVLGLGVGLFAGRVSAPRHEVVARTGVIVSSTGSQVGTVQLLREPQPMVVLLVANPRPGPGERTCQLLLRDGRRVDVGSWSYEGIKDGVWAAHLDPALLGAVGMQVVDEQGAVLATAMLS